ncbi:aspartyl-tRNA(Asn)/glutamyl-tRNA(Gln) amidotransferase subunit A [Enhydrobacter aerosaccus]|uniref:Indoleacetamide hydrolase n=1 Tax=Enhydrobacter aerosaccus TaxID=225324 RepID=A0A1T4N725_9HYPH|nr:Asp-tRNA(Asn)/Glu-tRNA(Gln) amidotransferase GatCAB subunit A [Enhydrobacter aerosaccus]SJZ74876.1 aspartyl-tRNA(Asn)/glutamyl-tRNA(Gln) amidotransferase subunit A [Enhydrobacter aerosaccus]
MKRDALALEDLSTIADAIAARRISSVEATEACLARIESWQPRTNAFLRLHKDKALTQAKTLDSELAAGKRRGPLHGVPMAHKDMYYRKGEISTGGSGIRREWRAPVTATVLQKLDAAGVVELGFLNMAEFAAGPTGHNVHHGHCRNPWDGTRVTGGSSSGSGSAVAARMVYGALGSDTGGSIRLPAAACGVVGMKATYGRVSRAGAVARSWSLDHVGPLTRTVRDNARLLAVLAGHDANDSTSSQKAVPDYEALLDGGVSSLKIGLALPDDGPAALDAQIGAAVQAAADALGRIGAKISAVTLPDFTALYRAAEVMVKCEAAAMHRPWLEKQPEAYANQVRTRMEAGFFIPATQYIDALRLRAHFVAEFLATMDGLDAVLLPAIPFPIPTIEETDVEAKGGPATLSMVGRFTGLTRPFNTLGVPALSVPCGFDSNGLPIGLQLVGRPFDEALLYRIGHAYQGVTDHHRRVPA